MADIKLIEDITNAFGPSGFEEDVCRVVKKYASDLIEITSKPIWDEKNKKFSQSKITHYYIY